MKGRKPVGRVAGVPTWLLVIVAFVLALRLGQLFVGQATNPVVETYKDDDAAVAPTSFDWDPYQDQQNADNNDAAQHESLQPSVPAALQKHNDNQKTGFYLPTKKSFKRSNEPDPSQGDPSTPRDRSRAAEPAVENQDGTQPPQTDDSPQPTDDPRFSAHKEEPRTDDPPQTTAAEGVPQESQEDVQDRDAPREPAPDNNSDTKQDASEQLTRSKELDLPPPGDALENSEEDSLSTPLLIVCGNLFGEACMRLATVAHVAGLKVSVNDQGFYPFLSDSEAFQLKFICMERFKDVDLAAGLTVAKYATKIAKLSRRVRVVQVVGETAEQAAEAFVDDLLGLRKKLGGYIPFRWKKLLATMALEDLLPSGTELTAAHRQELINKAAVVYEQHAKALREELGSQVIHIDSDAFKEGGPLKSACKALSLGDDQCSQIVDNADMLRGGGQSVPLAGKPSGLTTWLPPPTAADQSPYELSHRNLSLSACLNSHISPERLPDDSFHKVFNRLDDSRDKNPPLTELMPQAAPYRKSALQALPSRPAYVITLSLAPAQVAASWRYEQRGYPNYVVSAVVTVESLRAYVPEAEIIFLFVGICPPQLRDKLNSLNVTVMAAEPMPLQSKTAHGEYSSTAIAGIFTRLRALQLCRSYDKVILTDPDLTFYGNPWEPLKRWRWARLLKRGMIASTGLNAPANAGFLMLKPSCQAFVDLVDIAWLGFDPQDGWLNGAYNHPNDFWSKWDFHGADLEQGLLYLYYHLINKDALFLGRRNFYQRNRVFYHYGGAHNKPWLTPERRLGRNSQAWWNVYDPLCEKHNVCLGSTKARQRRQIQAAKSKENKNRR